MTRLVTVDVPKDKRNRFGLPSGKAKPDSISRGITEVFSTGIFTISMVGLVDLKVERPSRNKSRIKFIRYEGHYLLFFDGKKHGSIFIFGLIFAIEKCCSTMATVCFGLIIREPTTATASSAS